jgi:OOP family OmpA-OmpF porin
MSGAILKIISLVGLIDFFLIAYSQENGSIKNPSLAIHFFTDDFNTSDYIHTHSINSGFLDWQLSNIKSMNTGLVASYFQGLSNHLDFSGSAAFSSLDYPARNGLANSLGNNNKYLLMEADASIIAKLLSDNHRFSPFVTGGLGFSAYKTYFGAFVPAGIGLQAKITGETFALLNIQYRAALTDKVDNHFYYSLGLVGRIWNKKIKKKHNQQVPTAFRMMPKKFNNSNDSLNTNIDAPLLVVYSQGPDSDGDGIPDKDDKCPTVPGFARYNGCPIPDTDSDGISDEEDKGSLAPGPKENCGCPLLKEEIVKKVNFIAKNIFFETDKYEILPRSYYSLKELANVLKADPTLNLDIEGHTDITSTPAHNRILSENRAKAVHIYLTEKARINFKRLSYAGYGSTRPVATNKTVEGKAMNRRVELKLRY